MCRGELPVAIIRLMSKCLWRGWSGSEELRKCAFPSPVVPYSPVIREWSKKKTQIEIKNVEYPMKFCKFLFLSGFFLWVWQNFCQQLFSEHHDGFVFSMTYYFQKVKVGKKKVLDRCSFNSFFSIWSFYLQLALSESVFENLNLKIVKLV